MLHQTHVCILQHVQQSANVCYVAMAPFAQHVCQRLPSSLSAGVRCQVSPSMAALGIDSHSVALFLIVQCIAYVDAIHTPFYAIIHCRQSIEAQPDGRRRGCTCCSHTFSSASSNSKFGRCRGKICLCKSSLPLVRDAVRGVPAI